MIEQEFDSSSIKSFQLGVSLFSGERYWIPTDTSVDPTFMDMLSRTIGSINVRSGDWEEFSLSQEYGRTERVFTPLSDEIFKNLSDMYQAETYPDMSNLLENINEVDYYFVVFHDGRDRKFIGVRRAAQLKSILAARHRIMQLIDNTMYLIENPVFRLDKDFDGLIGEGHIYFSNFQNMEYIAKITNKVAKAAQQRIPVIADNVTFLDFSGFENDIENHPRTARLLVAISKRPNLDKYDREEILRQAAAQGVAFVNHGSPRLKCRAADKHKLLEVLDDRRWISRNATDGPVPYRAPSRQKARI
ncbi:Kiwa anti-phage protein KwaB-like domain-containing protein [Hansschlegelia beijingensis]|uniref:DUF4868 domain-containing protein n=1 Tax=Hansschlegelia beijingensis TaxID=1133344 RepID=A0A7W6D1Q9_9HYPH|nr:Kiwa anti-phage protein KwaB-like domain-containing protein [Hansschlegelia beijingensis]MBB3972795.1 hypothetical protein [Hansschlegelia beijingensis]